MAACRLAALSHRRSVTALITYRRVSGQRDARRPRRMTAAWYRGPITARAIERRDSREYTPNLLAQSSAPGLGGLGSLAQSPVPMVGSRAGLYQHCPAVKKDRGDADCVAMRGEGRLCAVGNDVAQLGLRRQARYLDLSVGPLCRRSSSDHRPIAPAGGQAAAGRRARR